jgi:hypothetical protein
MGVVVGARSAREPVDPALVATAAHLIARKYKIDPAASHLYTPHVMVMGKMTCVTFKLDPPFWVLVYGWSYGACFDHNNRALALGAF